MKRMNKVFTVYLLISIFCSFSTELKSQCKIENNYFQAGESLNYDMYYKYGILYTKAGTSSLAITNDKYNGKDCYKMSLTAKSSGAVKKFFSLSDTMTSYMTKELVPLSYMKDAHESKDHTVERATYNYSAGKISLRNVNVRNGNLRYDTILYSNKCMYDMLSIVYYVRTLDFSSMKKGDRTTVSFFSGRKKMEMNIEYHGIETVKANDDNEYYCVKLVLIMSDDAFEDKDEAMKVYLSNDFNRIPIRIDSKLKVGSTRIILKNFKGQKN